MIHDLQLIEVKSINQSGNCKSTYVDCRSNNANSREIVRTKVCDCFCP